MRRAITTPLRVLTLGHYGGLPEAAMVLGPLLLVGSFLAIARKGDSRAGEDEEDEPASDPGRGGGADGG